MTQTARPASDVTWGNWTPAGEDDLWRCVDDVVRDDDSTVIQESGSSHCEMRLSEIETPAAGTVSVIDWARNTGAGADPTCTFTLIESLTTTIATWTHSSIGNSYETNQYDLSTAERDSISNWSQLSIRCDRTSGVADIMLTQIYLEAPDPAATQIYPAPASHAHTADKPTISEATSAIQIPPEDSTHTHLADAPFAREPLAGNQYAYPKQDITTGSWGPNTGTSLWAAVDDAHDAASPNGQYIFEDGDDYCEMLLSAVGYPCVGTVTIYWRHRQEGPLSSVTGTGYLFCGSTQIASWTMTPTSVWAQESYTLTSPEQISITSYEDLRVRVDWAANNNIHQVSQIYVKTPACGQPHSVAIADATHGHTADAPGISQVHSTIPIADSTHSHSADDAPIWEGLHLYIASTVHLGLPDEVDVSCSHVVLKPQ